MLANYASDSDSDTESGPSVPVPPRPAARPAATNGAAPAAKAKRKGPIKITLDLPKASDEDASEGVTAKSRGQSGTGNGEAGAEDAGERPPKKAKLGGAGSSALLGMLPPPKRKIAAPAAKPVLAADKVMKPAAPTPAPKQPANDEDADDADELRSHAAGPGSASASADLDLFGLSSAASSSSRPAAAAAAAPKPAVITSAPAVADFVPPPPTPDDPYPGYYQLPSGAWAAYDPEYYNSFFAPAAEEDPDAGKGDDGRVGRHWDGLDDMARSGIVDVNVAGGLAAARAEEERKARMVKPKLPGEEFEYQAIGQVKGLAAERHQLTSLLNTAFSQRESLEARIAENKKNMRMASTKYGF